MTTPGDGVIVFDWLAIGVVGLLWLAAYATRRRFLYFAAGIGTATLLSSILLLGWLVLPLMFWMWRRSPGRGFGWAFLATMALTTGAIGARIPWPPPLGPGPLRETQAVVRDERLVDHIWKARRRATGQPVRQAFHVVDLAFTPEGAGAPVHALDCVDAGSVPGLRIGARVPVAYAVSDPSTARIRGATRNFARSAFFDVVGLTFGLAAILAVVAFPILGLLDRRVRSSRLGAVLNPGRGSEDGAGRAADGGPSQPTPRLPPPDLARRLAAVIRSDEQRKAIENAFREPQ